MNAPFAPGDRVLVECVARESGNGGVMRVEIGSGMAAFTSLLSTDLIHPIPTPVSHLRAAAEVCRPMADIAPTYTAAGVVPSIVAECLDRIADHLESSAAPKPPTLAETVAEAVSHIDRGYSSWGSMCEAIRKVQEALAREPGAAT